MTLLFGKACSRDCHLPRLTLYRTEGIWENLRATPFLKGDGQINSRDALDQDLGSRKLNAFQQPHRNQRRLFLCGSEPQVERIQKYGAKPQGCERKSVSEYGL